ncbi:MAG TPA: DUF4350 domain-containing protein [Abditibacteriaceae bacterium]|jgi:hypothetical protein
MKEKMRGRGPAITVILLFLLACWLGIASRQQPLQSPYPRAGFKDATPLGGKGLQLLLQRLGFSVKRHTERIKTMPPDARAWLLLDPQTQFSRTEADLLLAWVADGGTFVWAASPDWFGSSNNTGVQRLRTRLQAKTSGGANFPTGDELPALVPYSFGAASVLRSGVTKASGSGSTVEIDRTYQELAGNPVGIELAEMRWGKGRVIIAPDALLFTNYALSKDDNAVLVSNFVRAGSLNGGVYFDERAHGELAQDGKEPFEPNLLYYLTHGAARWAMLQLAFAGLLLWAYYGRRLGAPVPLPDREPVTRAGQFALAMGLLFRKANRPKAAAEILGEEFRRSLARRLGLSPNDPDEILAAAAERATGLPSRFIDRLLLKSKNPATTDAEALADAQDMEQVLRRLDQR